MSGSKQLTILVLTAVIGWCALELGARHSLPGVPSVISTAEAVVGRPLTPVSVAGMTRRTVRRCAVGVYNC